MNISVLETLLGKGIGKIEHSNRDGPMGCARFVTISLCARLLWSLSSVDFHTLTLQLPIQAQNSLAPELQVFVSSLEFQQNEHNYGLSSIHCILPPIT